MEPCFHRLLQNQAVFRLELRFSPAFWVSPAKLLEAHYRWVPTAFLAKEEEDCKVPKFDESYLRLLYAIIEGKERLP